ncbi:MAG: 5'/3'-nucleotidase SurE [Anaerolineae bacterium]|nr:5'/3'-nucleotidase SurE [Anaerolineae bacterium]
MKKSKKKHILLSNDDGIDSPGLWAAAEALSDLGYVTVAAPRDHMSATGRGFQKHADGRIIRKKLTVKGQDWDVYAVGGSPSQSVAHGILEVVPQHPDLVVSGINFGENFGTDITYSGTVGAAIEAASLGIPALAMSQQILFEDWDSFHDNVDFAVAAYFTAYFAKILLKKRMPLDVDVLNVVVPAGATPETPWKVTRLAKVRYYKPYVIRQGKMEGEARITSHILADDEIPPDNDIHTVRIEKKVAVIPISLDLTSRVSLDSLENLLRGQ